MIYRVFGILLAAVLALPGGVLPVRKANGGVITNDAALPASGTNLDSTRIQATTNSLTKDSPSLSSAQIGDADFIAPNLRAKSFRGEPAPKFVVEKWISQQPDTNGKFVLIDFWATWCGPCRESIPLLNALQKKYANQIAVIGVSDEAEQDVRRVYDSYFQYAIAIDTKRRMYLELQGTAIPHCILIDPSGIVRYEGHPAYLNEKVVQHFLNKYSK